jgi:hypothetical protein
LEERIKKYFPYVAAREKHFNSGLVVYSKLKDVNADNEVPILFEEKQSFNKPRWINDENLTKKEINNIDTNYFSYVDDKIEYGTTYETKLKSIGLKSGNSLTISFDVRMPDVPVYDEIMLVVSIENAKGESLVWRSLQFNPYVFKPNVWSKLYYGYCYQEELNPDDILKVFVYNRKRKYAELDNFVLKVYEGTP